jgi:hypothetical protein
MATPPTRSGGERKADIQARLTEAGVPWTAAMTVAGLRQREAAAAYDTSKMSRENVKALTIATLREILAISGGGEGGGATLPAKPKHADYVDAVFALNTAAYAEEAEKVAAVPLDVFRIVAGYLPTHAAKMRLAVAVGDRERIAEIAKSAHPTEITVIQSLSDLTKHPNLDRVALMQIIAEAMKANHGWKIEDTALGTTLLYRPKESDYVISDVNLPGFFVKVNQNQRVNTYIFLYYEMDHRFSAKDTTKKAFADILDRLTTGMEWIWRYTIDGLKPHVFCATFNYKPCGPSLELTDPWDLWVRRQIRIYKRRKV